MKLLEHQGKSLLRQWGIPVPRGFVVQSAGKVFPVLNDLNGATVLKIQVPVGKRGKAGGIKVVRDVPQAEAFIGSWQGKRHGGYAVSAFLAEEVLDVEQEFYLSVALNSVTGGMCMVFSEAGGMDIEEVAAASPEKIMKVDLTPGTVYREFFFRKLFAERGFKGKRLLDLSRIAERLGKGFVDNDLTLVEINPLAALKNGELMAADAKVEIDDSALFRHKEFLAFKAGEEDPLEREATEIGVTYIRLDGDVGIIASGAGLSMNTMDEVFAAGHTPANFLETGGGITHELMRKAVGLVTRNQSVKGLVVNLYGGVNPLLAAATGIVAGIEELGRRLPVVVKAMGNQQEECWSILEKAGVPVIKNHRTEDAVAYIARQLEASGR